MKQENYMFMYEGVLITKENSDTFLIGVKERELKRGDEPMEVLKKGSHYE